MTDATYLHPGRVISGRFRLEERLGEGAVGDVWRATHLAEDCSVAIKVLSPRFAGSHGDRQIARFLEEATLARRVECAHVVRVVECGLCLDVGPYIAMEQVDGLDLFEHVARSGPLSPGETVTIVAQLCTGLESLHAADVFHRDVKPENIVLSSRDGLPCAKLIDFGIAVDRAASPDESNAGIVGTPAYMSPERLVGAPDANAMADSWGAAVVAYHCLTGRVPFDDTTVGTLCLSMTRGSFVPPSQLRTDLPRKLDGWFRRALASDASKRFGSVLALREALIEACSPFVLASPKSRASGISGSHPRYVQREDVQWRDAS